MTQNPKSPTPAELNRRNPNHDAFWQARGLPQRPPDWQARIARERAARARPQPRERETGGEAPVKSRRPHTYRGGRLQAVRDREPAARLEEGG